MTNDEGNPNDEFPNVAEYLAQLFVIRTSVFIRASTFGFCHSLLLLQETIAPAWLSIFGARPTSHWNWPPAFQSHSRAHPMRFPKRARSDFQSRSILQAA